MSKNKKDKKSDTKAVNAEAEKMSADTAAGSAGEVIETEEAAGSDAPEDIEAGKAASEDTEAGNTDGSAADEAANGAGSAEGADGAEGADNAENAESADAEAAGEADGEDESGSGKMSRKEKKLLEKKEEELAALKDRYMRTLAEYENFRKRTEKEKGDIYAYAVRDVCAKILPVLDNLERGLAAVTEETKDDPFAVGMDQIGKQFVKALEDIGVKAIDAKGETFDPNLHNAVMHVDDESLGENVVAEELMKGYTYKGTVVRHSMVKVAN